MDSEESQSQQILRPHRRHEDCWPCRLISGFGIIGIGAYIYHQAKRRPVGIGRDLMVVLSAGTAIMGTTRLAGAHPFQNNHYYNYYKRKCGMNREKHEIEKSN